MYYSLMYRETPLVTGETYHIVNRGAHKQPIFFDELDYTRAKMLLYLHNDTRGVVMRDLLKKYRGRSYVEVYKDEKPGKDLIDILAYCLMPNHFHLVLRQKMDGGISLFMRKFSTAYSMHFNTKYDHSGVVFQGRFRSTHVASEEYYRYLFSYVHLNPLSIIDPNWKEAGLHDVGVARTFIHTYENSSYIDYSVRERPERAILATEDVPSFLLEQNDFEDLVKWSHQVHT